MNETARLEWLDADALVLRLEYANAFYGTCTFVARVVRKRNLLLLDRGSVSSEKYAVKRGELPTLLKMGTTFLERLLLKSRSLEDLDYPSRQSQQAAFPAEIVDAAI